MLPGKYDAVVSCFANKTDKERVDCFAQQVNNTTLTSLLQCVGDGRPTADKLMQCGAVPKIKSDAEGVRNCIAKAATPDAKRNCLLNGVAPQYQKLTQCLATAGTPATAAACLDVISPDYKNARTGVACLNDPKNSLLGCSEQILTGNAKTVATCLLNARDTQGRFDCASSTNPELSRVKKVAECVNESAQTDKLVGCVAPYLGGDGQKFAGCIAGSSANLGKCLSTISPQMKAADDTLKLPGERE